VTRGAAWTAAAAAALLVLLACATARDVSASPCAGLAPPRMLSPGPVSLPAAYTSARVGGLVTEEIVVAPDGTARDLRVIGASTDLLVPFAEHALRHARFAGGTIENNPVAIRAVVTAAVGAAQAGASVPTFPTLRAFVPGGEPREARWQLRDSVRRIAVAGRAALPRGGELVARAADGKTERLETLTASADAREFLRTVSTRRFFARAGDYRIELREGGKASAAVTFTIAADAEHAVVNACEPLAIPALASSSRP